MYCEYSRERDAKVSIKITQLRENICHKIQLLFINMMGPNLLKAPLSLPPRFSRNRDRRPADRQRVLIGGLLCFVIASSFQLLIKEQTYFLNI